MATSNYLVFGDLHGRVLPAFRLATVWAREHSERLSGILQVGDLGYFPDLTRMDKATRRHAEDDPLELGVQDVIAPNDFADQVFNDPDCPEAMWFTSGNHEDFETLLQLSGSSGRQPHFSVDAYCRVQCIKNGEMVQLADGLRVGALWGVDGEAETCRKNLPSAAYISQRKADQLLANNFHVLLTHDAPRGAKRTGFGSGIVFDLLKLAQPAFAFFGHYKGEGTRITGEYGPTDVYHLAGMELRGSSGSAENGCVGVLTWAGSEGSFQFIDPAWLRTFTRHNWKWR